MTINKLKQINHKTKQLVSLSVLTVAILAPNAYALNPQPLPPGVFPEHTTTIARKAGGDQIEYFASSQITKVSGTSNFEPPDPC